MGIWLSEEEMKALDEKCGPVIRKIVGFYQRGMLTDDEVLARLSEEMRLAECRPAAVFGKRPENIAVPDRHPGHFPGEWVIGWNIWEDTIPPETKAGDRVVLTDRRGLKTELVITKAADHDYEGIGTIEGYTSTVPREIKVCISDGKICGLDYMMENSDYEAFRAFPLWREYVEYMDRVDAAWKVAVREVLEYYKNENR